MVTDAVAGMLVLPGKVRSVKVSKSDPARLNTRGGVLLTTFPPSSVPSGNTTIESNRFHQARLERIPRPALGSAHPAQKNNLRHGPSRQRHRAGQRKCGSTFARRRYLDRIYRLQSHEWTTVSRSAVPGFTLFRTGIFSLSRRTRCRVAPPFRSHLGVHLRLTIDEDQRDPQGHLLAVGQGDGSRPEGRIILVARRENLDHPRPVIVGHSSSPPQFVYRQTHLAAGGKKFALSRIDVLRQLSLDHVTGFQRGNFYGLLELHLNVDGGLLREVRMLHAGRRPLGWQGLR